MFCSWLGYCVSSAKRHNWILIWSFQTSVPAKNSLEKARLAGDACSRGEFELAVELYTEAINQDPGNHVFYSNRSAAFIKTQQFEQALEDGKATERLQPGWYKVWEYRELQNSHNTTIKLQSSSDVKCAKRLKSSQGSVIWYSSNNCS